MTGKPTYEELEQRVKKLKRDAAKLKRTENLLKYSEEKYRRLVNNLPGIVFKGYKDWTVEFFDQKIESITGYAAEEFNSRRMKWFELIVDEDLEAVKEYFIRALKTKKMLKHSVSRQPLLRRPKYRTRLCMP